MSNSGRIYGSCEPCYSVQRRHKGLRTRFISGALGLLGAENAIICTEHPIVAPARHAVDVPRCQYVDRTYQKENAMSLINNPAALLWRAQFKAKDDFELAGKVLKKFKFISATRFKRDMGRHIQCAIPPGSKAAFFIERELKLVKPNWPYKQSRGYEVKNKFTGRIAEKMYPEKAYPRGRGVPPRWRAEGSALPAVKSPTNLSQEIGSEGVVAAIVSKICDNDGQRLVLHPHTTLLRKMKVQRLVVVTDFIGSGTRTRQMLDALWRVASIRSWNSAGYLKIMVICYSATERGLHSVQQHPAKPEVTMVRKCPTISNSFTANNAELVQELCTKFPPGVDMPLGYKATGALISFEHSCPNNVPAMFTVTQKKKDAPWFALFPKRTTSEFGEVHREESPEELHRSALNSLKLGEVCRHPAFIDSSTEQQAVVVFLAAIYRGRRNTSDIISVCELTLLDLSNAWASALAQQLVTEAGRLTLHGHNLLRSLRSEQAPTQSVSILPKIDYYPTSLREPTVGS